MNIFVLDKNPAICANYHCDKHVVKMILETAQLLSNAHWLTNNKAPYKLTHSKHPCTLWVSESSSNYKWLCELGMSLCYEYTKRYKKIHKTQAVLNWLKNNIPNLPNKGLTEYRLAMPDMYKTNDSVESYRNYYINAKRNIATWKYSNKPEWFK